MEGGLHVGRRSSHGEVYPGGLFRFAAHAQAEMMGCEVNKMHIFWQAFLTRWKTFPGADAGGQDPVGSAQPRSFLSERFLPTDALLTATSLARGAVGCGTLC